MARIRSLRPNVTREEATEHFSSGMFDFLRESTFGPLRSVADFYIPFHLFQVEILNSGKRQLRIFGLDAVDGSLDLFTFEQLPNEREVFYLETRNYSEPILGEGEAKNLLTGKVQRLLFSRGFFRMRSLQINAEPVVEEMYLPYWVGFRGRGARARLAVIDAVRRRPEGAKVRQLIRTWLTSIRTT
jgi:hypothetical protein